MHIYYSSSRKVKQLHLDSSSGKGEQSPGQNTSICAGPISSRFLKIHGDISILPSVSVRSINEEGRAEGDSENDIFEHLMAVD